MDIDINDLSFGIQGKPLIQDIDLRMASGQIVGLVGPNGSGKTTLLKNIYRIYTPDSGRVSFDGCDSGDISHKALARMLAVVSQTSSTAFEFSVFEVVLMGRAPHHRMLESDSHEDHQLAMAALDRVGLAAYAQRSVTTLSGGEQQRVMLARAIAQKPRVLVLDEPTNHLDIRHGLELMNFVRSLGITAVVALHNLNTAASYCDQIHIMQRGRIVVSGTPENVFTPALLSDVFGVNAQVIRHPETGRPYLVYLSSTASATPS